MANQLQLPPWLQISPEHFTQAAIAGGQQGYQAAAQAGELAQKGLLSAASLASEAAGRAADIAVRREAINAELAKNAANVSAARYNAALDFQNQQAVLEEARQRQAAAVAEAALNREASAAAQDKALAGAENVAKIQANRDHFVVPPETIKLMQARDAAIQAGNIEDANLISQQLQKMVSMPEPRVTVGGGMAGIPTTPRFTGTPDQVADYMRTNSPSGPVGGSTNLWEQFNAWRR